MNKLFVVLLAIILSISQCTEIKKCNSEPISAPPEVLEEKIMNYILKEKVIHNEVLGYDTFRAQNLEDNTSVTVKLYLRPQPDTAQATPLEQYYWTYKDNPADPPKECDQMKYINDIVKAEKAEDLRFEECLSSDDTASQTEGSTMPYVNAFERANGEPLSNYCIFDNCRTKLQKIATLMIKGLKLIASGTQYFFLVNEITPDNIYYFDMGPTKYLTYTDMKYNAVPVTDKKLAPWLKDMHKCGEVLAKLLARSCEFIISEESKKSTLFFYKQIHQLEDYDHNDVDVGVNPMLNSSNTQDPEEKKKMLNDSLYDFILKLLEGPNQFTDPSMALQHNFITKAASTRIDRPSDMQ